LHPAQRLVFVSSLAARLPSVSAYAASKQAAEALVLARAGALILRPCAIYGPGDKATLPLMQQLTKTIAVIPGRATSRFSLIHVDDFANVLVAAVQSERSGLVEVDDMDGPHDWAQLVGLTQAMFGRPRSYMFLPQAVAMAAAGAAQTVARMAGRSSMITPDKMREMYGADWTTQPPGWPRHSPIPLRQGLQHTFDWYMAHGWLKQFRKLNG
jgi:nucleoside-diphosphate-sugar epimerase